MQNNKKLHYNKYGLVFKILHNRYNAIPYKLLMVKGHAELRTLYRTNANRAIEEEKEELNLED